MPGHCILEASNTCRHLGRKLGSEFSKTQKQFKMVGIGLDVIFALFFFVLFILHVFNDFLWRLISCSNNSFQLLVNMGLPHVRAPTG